MPVTPGSNWVIRRYGCIRLRYSWHVEQHGRLSCVSWGCLVMLCGGAIWLIGGHRIRMSHLRRLGQEPLLFYPAQLSTKNYSPQEKRRRMWYFLAAIVVGAVGSAIANGAIG